MSDHLEPEDGAFGLMGSLDYQLAVRRALAPPGRPMLHMVALPSFEPEHAVFVCAGPVVHAGRLVTQLWAQAGEQSLEAPTHPGRPAVFRPPTAEVFARTKPEARWASATLAETAFQVIRAAWDAALLRTRWRQAPGLGLDGTNFHFASGSLSGRVWSPEAGSPCAALVALGAALTQLTDVPEHLRSERQRAIENDARNVAALFERA